MPISILMPALSPTMKEGNLAKWLKKQGDKIKAGEVIAEIETDKATMEVEAVDEGILGKILVAEGTENVAVNTCIALILEEDENPDVLNNYQEKKQQTKSQNKEDATNNVVASVVNQASFDNVSQQNFTHDTKYSHKASSKASPKASPLAKRIAQNANISLLNIIGTGPNSRIIKKDVLLAIQNHTNSATKKPQRNPQLITPIKNNNVRKVIAKRLQESKQNVPHFYLSCEFNIDKLNELRATINSVASTNEKGLPEYKISVNDMIIKATAMALNKTPSANASWSDEAILLYNNIDISVAVAIEGGLITPIIKNADQKSLQEISNEAKLLIKKAKEGKLQPEEFQGGSFSISNLGMFGIDQFCAIVNPPQSCILAVSRAVEKPIVENGQIKIANMVNFTISCDHRVIDGAVGAEFLKALRLYIEQPVLNLL
jgi:pyruvate dehydrogenase E2 component (dihydrolipoamide acetyltransferase)